MPEKYRVGIIGSTGKGDYGHGVDIAFKKLPNVEIVAVADPDQLGRSAAQQRIGAGKAFADYRQMLSSEKLDLVAICPRWVDQHHEMLMASAEAGCHVYMEKPFCRTLAECDEVVRAMEMRHLKLGIAHITQYSPVLDTVLSLIEGGVIGEVLEIRGRGKEDQRGGGEDLWVLGSHVFGMMRSFGGGQPLTCSATVNSAGHPINKADVVQGAEGIGLLAGDQLQAKFAFAGGIDGHFASKHGMAGNPTRFGVQVFGSQGIVEMHSGYLNPAYILRDSSWSPGRTGSQWEMITSAGIGNPEPRTGGSYEGGHIAAINDLIDSIENEHQTKCSYEDGSDIVEMIAAIFESHRRGRTVELPLKVRQNPLSLL